MENNVIKEIQSFTFIKMFKLYPTAIKLKANEKKKAEDKNQLLNLDNWMQHELGSTVGSRKKPHITREELVDLMKWKLLRGKWRPKLVQLAESNAPEKVIEITAKSISYAKESDVEVAIKKLCELKGVGPATASAILAICAPSNCSFFADEVAEIFLKGKLNYTLPEYLIINNKILEIKEFLNSEGEHNWTAHDIELTIWTFCIVRKHDSSLLLNEDSNSSPAPKRAKR